MENDIALKQMPSFFKILVYTFNLPGCIASPFYEYQDFEDWIEIKGRYANIPSTLVPGFIRLLQGASYIFTVTILGMYHDEEIMYSQEF